jgi:hypothetical protein
MKIEWNEAEDLERRGHGVKFYHEKVRPSEEPIDRPIIAFLDGYDWLHVGEKATILHLTTDSPIFSESSDPIAAILEVKIAVLTFLLDHEHFFDIMKEGNPREYGVQVTDRVYAGFNA